MIARVAPLAFGTAETVETAEGARIAVIATSVGDIRLSLHRDIAGLHDEWTAFEKRAVCTHAQTYTWIEAWHRLVAAPAGAEAAIVTGRSAAGLLFIWPLEIVAARGGKTLKWIGQDHTNYNMGLHDRDFAGRIGAKDVRALLQAAVNLAGGASLASFLKQPVAWEGVANPFAKLAHQPSPSAGHIVTLERDFDAVFNQRFGKKTRNSLKRKERKLASFGSIHYGWARSLGERTDLLEIFFAQKSEWFAQTGIADAFAARHRAFYRAMAALEDPEDGQLQIGFMKIGEEIVATFIGVQRGDRFSVLLSSITNGDMRRWSPGLLLMREQIRDLCSRGLRFYDLGVGEARHKDEWSDVDVPLFDSFIGFGLMGKLATWPLAVKSRLKRTIKNQPRLWAMARTMRRLLHGRTGPGQPDTD